MENDHPVLNFFGKLVGFAFVSFLVILVWNTLTFVLLRFLGFRTYGITVATLWCGWMLALVATLPLFLLFNPMETHFSNGDHRVFWGLLSLPLTAGVLICLRLEASIYRREHAEG